MSVAPQKAPNSCACSAALLAVLAIQDFDHAPLYSRDRRQFAFAELVSGAAPRLKREALLLPIGVLAGRASSTMRGHAVFVACRGGAQASR